MSRASSLTDPATNMDYGQSFIELIRAKSATQGQLPRVIAAYNAGPVPVARWAYIQDRGDPLLWIESIPYWETRYYVPAVLRNMWVYPGAGRRRPAEPRRHRRPSLAGISDEPHQFRGKTQLKGCISSAPHPGTCNQEVAYDRYHHQNNPRQSSDRRASGVRSPITASSAHGSRLRSTNRSSPASDRPAR